MSAFDEIAAHPAYELQPGISALSIDTHQRLAAVLQQYRILAAIQQQYRILGTRSAAMRRQKEDERLAFLSYAVEILIKAGSLEFQGEDASVLLDLMQEWLDSTAARRCFTTHRGVMYTMIRLAISAMQLPSRLYVRGVDIGAGRVDPAECGGFADIFVGKYGGHYVAVKRFRSHRARDGDLFKSLCREALVWRQLKHPFILPFIGIDKDTFASGGFLCLVSPWMRRGTLKNFISSTDYNASKDLDRILLEAAEGLEYLHAQKVIHGDLKDLNVLIDDYCHVQLCDFGLVVVGDTTATRMATTASGAGSGTWMSPERITEGHRRRTCADDVYAYACLCYYMCTGHAPFHELNELAAVFRIIKGDRPGKPVTERCTQELWNLVQVCWSQDPCRRPAMTSVLAWLRAAVHFPLPTSVGEQAAPFSQEYPQRVLPLSYAHDAYRPLPPLGKREDYESARQQTEEYPAPARDQGTAVKRPRAGDAKVYGKANEADYGHQPRHSHDYDLLFSYLDPPLDSPAIAHRPAEHHVSKRRKTHTISSKTYKVPAISRDTHGRPALPLNVGVVQVHCLGRIELNDSFHTERYIFPVGYHVSRRYMSMVDPTQEVIYQCSVITSGDQPNFQVVAADLPDKPIVAGTATAAWAVVVRTSNHIRNLQHSKSVSGPEIFGLGHNTIRHLIQELPGASSLKDYVWQHFVEGA